MTITPEETPRLANAAERNVYQALRAQLQPNDCVVPGQRVTDHLKDHEVDFVVAIEGAGIVCLEVKGGDVWHDGDTWWQRRRGHERLLAVPNCSGSVGNRYQSVAKMRLGTILGPIRTGDATAPTATILTSR